MNNISKFLLLIVGLILNAAGLRGLHEAGKFWTMSFATSGREDALAIGLPAIVLLSGSFIVSYEILCGTVLSARARNTRLFVYVFYAALLLVLCWMTSQSAGEIAAEALQTT
jgi:hypothetical protein